MVRLLSQPSRKLLAIAGGSALLLAGCLSGQSNDASTDTSPVASPTVSPVSSPAPSSMASSSPATSSSAASPTPSTTPTPVATSEAAETTAASAPEETEAREEVNNAVPALDPGTALAPEAQVAFDTLATLEVKGRAPKTGYSRDQFGQAWADTDRNGCDTRNDILARDLTNLTFRAGSRACVVASGVLADPYTGQIINFVRGQDTSSAVQIDHVVALSDAWQSGAQQLSAEERQLFANDPANLLAVDGPANQQKSDGDAATWLPANTAYRCTYVSKQIEVKAKYRLWVKPAEKDAMSRVLSDCGARDPQPAQEAPAAPVEQAPVEQAPVEQAPAAEPAPAAPVEAPAEVPAPAQLLTDTYYKNCTAAREAGAAPLYAGSPGYRPQLDRDGDGVACE